MAGTRHHIIPRLLQKGFASKIDGETVFTWQYRKDAKAPQEISTKDTIVSKHFYGRGDLNADDLITELETTKLSPTVNALRSGVWELSEHSREIAELIAHLSIRSKLIRKGFEKMSRDFLDGMKGLLTNEETVDGLIGAAPSSFLDEQIDAVLGDPKLNDAMGIFRALGFENDDVKSMMNGLVEDQTSDRETRSETVTMFTGIMDQMFNIPDSSLAKTIKEGHIKGLLQNLVPEPRVNAYEVFTWSVQVPHVELALSDAPCLFRTAEKLDLSPSCDPKDAIAIYLPLSNKQLLIGVLESGVYDEPPAEINENVARCSYEQFIASQSTDEFSRLIPLIGSNAALASDAELDAEIDQIRENLRKFIYGDNDE